MQQPIPKPPTPPKSPPSHLDNLKSICINWSLRLNLLHTAIPATLHPPTDPVAWPPALTAALRRLSELTRGQMDRAHSLLGTYFRARIRRNLYQRQNRGIYARLEVVDVQDAIRSLQLMNRGQEVEGGTRGRSRAGVKRCVDDYASLASAKRKFSIRDEWQHSGGASRRASSSERSEASSDVTSASPHLRLASIPRAFSPARSATVRSHSFGAPYPHGPSRRLASIPTLNLKSPSPNTLAVPTPSKTARSPIWNLLNFPDTPTPGVRETPARLPPVSSLISEIVDDDKLSTNGPKVKIMKEQELKQLELEEAQAALEVARQKHVVATSRAAIARLELRKEDGLPARPKSAEK